MPSLEQEESQRSSPLFIRSSQISPAPRISPSLELSLQLSQVVTRPLQSGADSETEEDPPVAEEDQQAAPETEEGQEDEEDASETEEEPSWPPKGVPLLTDSQILHLSPSQEW